MRKKRVFPALSDEANGVPGGLYRNGVIPHGIRRAEQRTARPACLAPASSHHLPPGDHTPSIHFIFAVKFPFFLPLLTPKVVLQSQPKSAYQTVFSGLVCLFGCWIVCLCFLPVWLSFICLPVPPNEFAQLFSHTRSRKIRSVEKKKITQQKIKTPT